MRNLVALLTVASLTTGLPAPLAEEPTFLEQLQVEVVNVDVYVTDRKGNPITDLTAKDFTLQEDGKRVKITNFAVMGAAASSASQATSEAGSDEADRPSAHVLLLVDNYASYPHNRVLIMERLREYLAGAPADTRFAVASYDGYLRMRQPFTDDREEILAAVEEAGAISPLAMSRQTERVATVRQGFEDLRAILALARDEGRAPDVPQKVRSQVSQAQLHAEQLRLETRLAFEAMSHLVNSLAALPGVKALVFLSDGMPARPGDEYFEAIQEGTRSVLQNLGTDVPREADIDMRSARLGALADSAPSGGGRRDGSGATNGVSELTALANASRVSIYTLKPIADYGGIPSDLSGEAASLFTPHFRSAREQNLRETLRIMADDTGGVSQLGGDVGELIERARRDLGQHYSLGFTPADGADGQFHKLKVKVKRSGAQVRYRTGYVAKTVEMKLADHTSAALLLAHDNNPIGLTLEVGNGQRAEKDDQWLVPVTLGIPVDGISLLPQGGALAGDVQLLIASQDVNGDMAPVQGMAARIELPGTDVAQYAGQLYAARLNLLLRTGRQRVAIGLVDPIAGGTSFVSADVTVGGAS